MKVVVFDFDGVIIPSEGIKENGYRWMFSEFNEAVPEKAITAAREEFSGARGNRYDIIRSILKRIHYSGDLEQGVQTYGERFSAIVKKRIHELVVEPKVRAMLEQLSKKHPLYINSNNPDEPLRETLRTLGIEMLFKGVYGSSNSKLENLRSIARLESAQAGEMVFIGDGEGDMRAAKEFGCEFVGVATDLNGWKSGASEFKVLESVAAFDRKTDRGGERMV